MSSPKSPMTPRRIWMTVCNILLDVNASLEREDITPDARLVIELEIYDEDFYYVFTKALENFQLKLSRDQLFPKTAGKGYLDDSLTEESLKEAESFLGLPAYLPPRPEEAPTYADIFTVELLCRVIAKHCDVEWEIPA